MDGSPDLLKIIILCLIISYGLGWIGGYLASLGDDQ